MAGLADSCSSAHDHSHPDRRSSLAAVRREFGRQSFLSSSFHLLDNARNSSPHSPALGSRRAVARRTAGCRRCADDFVARLFHGPARELFHLALPAGDYRREHFVLSQNRLLITAACFILLAAMTFLSYTGRIPPTYSSPPTPESLRTWLVINVLGFLAVTYLASLLAQSLRSKGRELEEKREELLSLQDFTEDIIHSMRGGLITTDLSGRILLLNRTGEEILGLRFSDLHGKKLQELNEDFWLPGQYANAERLSL